jgi:hypothetical protein
MVWFEDLNNDGFLDLIASHVSWEEKFVHPYVAWYKGPLMDDEAVIIDRSTVGRNSRIYRFVLHDVDGDGRKDLIGQGYQPFHNGNKWYRQPVDAKEKWTEFHDYGLDLKNGHDLIVWDIEDDGREDLVLLDSWTGTIIVKPVPDSKKASAKWPFYRIVDGDGLTHYMSLFDVNRDGLMDIVLGREEDGGEGIKWYEHPGRDNVAQIWEKHFETEANFTKVHARDLDRDGDVDFVGCGEIANEQKGFWQSTPAFLGLAEERKSDTSSTRDIGWYERLSGGGFDFHEIDVEGNNNDVLGAHNCELVDIDADGDEDLLLGGVDVRDLRQRLRWYEFESRSGQVTWSEHPIDITSAEGWSPRHGYYNGEITWGDVDRDGDLDLAYAGVGSGFLGWFENVECSGANASAVDNGP